MKITILETMKSLLLPNFSLRIWILPEWSS